MFINAKSSETIEITAQALTNLGGIVASYLEVDLRRWNNNQDLGV